MQKYFQNRRNVFELIASIICSFIIKKKSNQLIIKMYESTCEKSF